jgi:hypothetical protein
MRIFKSGERMARCLAAVAALILAAASSPALAEDYVVIESSVPSIAVGATLSSDAKLEIAAKGRVVLITSTGRVVTLAGPFQGPPPASAGSGAPQPGQSDILKVLPALFNQKDQRTPLGAVRAIEATWRSDALKTQADAMAVDASDGGDTCLYDPSHAEVMHDPRSPGVMTVQSMSSGAQATLTWGKQALRQPWPSSLPLEDGDMLSFEQKGAGQAALATIHLLPPAPAASDVERALQMARAGCEDQARALLAVIAKSAE